MNMLHDRRGQVATADLVFLGLMVFMSMITAYLIINLNVYKTLFLFATGLLCVFSFANVNFGLFFIIFFMMFPNLMPRQMFGIVGINPFNLIFMSVIAIVSLRIVVTRGQLRFSEPVYLPMLLLFILQAIAILRFQQAVNITTLDNAIWLTRFLKPMQYAILFVLLVNFVKSKHTPILSIIILAGFLGAGLIIIELWLKYGFAMTETMTKDISSYLWANPLLGHKNNWAIMFTLAFFFVLALLGQRFSSLSVITRSLSLILAGLLIMAIIISLARVAYFCTIIGFVYFFWKRRRLQAIGIIILMAIMVSILPDIVRLRATQDLPTALNISTIDRFLAGRLFDRWLPALRAFIENPLFGRGYNGAGIYVLGPLYSTHPHSGYIATLCDIGLIGFAAMVWLFVAFWKWCSIIARDSKRVLNRRLALASKSQILILALSNITATQSFFYEPMVVAPFFLTVAMTFALYREEVFAAEKERSARVEFESAPPATMQTNITAS